eukprot:6673326-Prymnesium_polylepis.1
MALDALSDEGRCEREALLARGARARLGKVPLDAVEHRVVAVFQEAVHRVRPGACAWRRDRTRSWQLAVGKGRGAPAGGGCPGGAEASARDDDGARRM